MGGGGVGETDSFNYVSNKRTIVDFGCYQDEKITRT